MAEISSENFPNAPGVYLFKDKKGRIIYIGKSANLKARINSYFKSNEIHSPLKRALLKNAAKIDHKTSPSEIEALLLESRLIKKYQPKYNVLLKDNSQYFYVALTKEDFPRLLIVHRPDKIKNAGNTLGPFTDGTSLRAVLKILRKIFPFRTCKNPINKPCLYYELGLCPAHIRDGKAQIANGKWQMANRKNLKNQYAKNIKNLFLILRGKKTNLIESLKKEMVSLSKKQLYEKANKIKNRLLYFKNIFDHEKAIKEEFVKAKSSWQKTEKALRALLRTNKKINRIEGFDVSNIGEERAGGAMSVFINGKPAKTEYRKFKIRLKTKDDLSRLKEIIARRLAHKEWNFPQAILIDGGKAHLNILLKIIQKFGLKNKIAALALAKEEEKLYLADGRTLSLKQNPDLYPVLANIRDEAHRFAKDFLAAKYRPLF